jgi:hypothetical protein
MLNLVKNAKIYGVPTLLVLLFASNSHAQTSFAPVKKPDVGVGSILPNPSIPSAVLNPSAVTGQIGSLAPTGGIAPGLAAGAKGLEATETIAKFATGKQQVRTQDAVSNLLKAAEEVPRR